MLILDAAATRAGLPFDRLVPALAALFAHGCSVPPRQVLAVPAAEGAAPGGFSSLIMPAWVPGLAYGVKTVNVAPHNAARGLPALHASYQFYDASTGVPLALLDGDEITARRTVAASALAARFLARPEARRLLVVGAGRLARLLPAAMACVRPIDQVQVWARRPEAAAALAAALRAEGWDASAATELPAAVAAADIVSCATLATTPLVQGAWLQPGSHLDLIGSFTPAMREADDACFAGATLVIDTDEALAKSGDLLGPLASGVLTPERVHARLATLCRGQAPGRRHADERTVFKSVGTALEDLAAAMLVCGLALPAQAAPALPPQAAPTPPPG